MKNLKKVIDHENKLAEYFKGPQINIKALTDEDAQRLFGRLDSNLSPESLYQDGERSAAQAVKYQTLYIAAIKELQDMGFKYNDRFLSYYP